MTILQGKISPNEFPMVHFFHKSILCLTKFAVGRVKIFYVCFKKIFLCVGKSKSRSVDANKKTEWLMYSDAGGELRNISSTRKVDLILENGVVVLKESQEGRFIISYL